MNAIITYLYHPIAKPKIAIARAAPTAAITATLYIDSAGSVRVGVSAMFTLSGLDVPFRSSLKLINIETYLLITAAQNESLHSLDYYNYRYNSKIKYTPKILEKITKHYYDHNYHYKLREVIPR